MLRNIFLVIALGLSLAACKTTDLPSVVSGISLATTNVANPVTNTNVYQAKEAYLATVKLAVNYRQYCFSKTYAAIMADPVMKPACQDRRATVRLIQKTKAQASAALNAAVKFVRDNPSGNAISYITAAWTAIGNFKNAIPAQGT